MHTRTRSEYKSFVDSVYPKPNFCQRYCQNVLLLLFDANTDSGDVICIQGRDLSTNHLFILFISKTLLQSAPYVKMCHYYCLMPKPIVEMLYAYKDEI